MAKEIRASVSDLNLIREKLSNQIWRLENLYKIQNEEGEVVQFKLREPQRYLLENMHYKNIILKARQLGFTTFIEIFILDNALFRRNMQCGIIAQNREVAGEIFNKKILFPFENLPAFVFNQLKVKNKRGGNNGGSIEFENGSSIRVATTFRGTTLQMLHISEHGKICAKTPDKAQEIRTGTLNSIQQRCIVFIESTAEGVGGDFYNMCNQAQQIKALDNYTLNALDYKFFFFPWWQDKKYSTPIPEIGLALSPSDKEYFSSIETACHIKLTDEQKYWYIQKRDIELHDEMRQEFPSTPQEAFLTSGSRVFSENDCLLAEGGIEPPICMFDINPYTGKKVQEVAPSNLEIKSIQNSVQNKLLVWEIVEENEEYVIGADVSEGLQGGDFCVVDVIKKSTGMQVAHWWGKLDPFVFAHLLSHIGKEYNMAFLVPERNNHGGTVVTTLREVIKYPKSRIYREQVYDKTKMIETDRLGWITTKQSKAILVDDMRELLRVQKSGIRWIGTLQEFNSYIINDKGGYEAQSGCHDDQVMSFMIAQEGTARSPKQHFGEIKISHDSNDWRSM